MSFLDQSINNLSRADILRLIRQEVANQIPPIPAGVATLADGDVPLVPPDPSTVSDGNVLVFDGSKASFGADVIRAGSLEANMVLGTTITAGDPAASHIELGLSSTGDGSEGFSAFAADGVTKTFDIDAETGTTYMKGRLDFGTSSRLQTDDVVKIQKQASAGFQVPARAQNVNMAIGNVSSLTAASPTWNSPTQTGNTLFMAITSRAQSSLTTPIAPNTPTGWTFLDSGSQGGVRHSIYYILTAASRTGAESVTWGATSHVDAVAIQMFEISGIASLDINTAVSKANSSAVLGTATGVLGQAGEYLITFTGINDTGSGVGAATGGFSNYSRGVATINSVHPIIAQPVMQIVSDLITTATTSAQVGYSLSNAADWINFTATFKAKAAGAVGTPDSGSAVLYTAQDSNSHSKLHETNDDGFVGSLMLSPTGTRWRMEFATVSVVTASTAADTNVTQTVSLGTLALGDLCFWVGISATSSFTFYTDPVCTVGGQITLRGRNTDGSAHGQTATHSFLIVHLS